MGRKKELCLTCEKIHSGVYRIGTGACYKCGQIGHMKNDCPFLQGGLGQGSVQSALPPALIVAQPMRQIPT